MNMNAYQDIAYTFAMYTHSFYPKASLVVEAAELIDLFVKPELRGDKKEINRNEIISEAGDVLWNLAALLRDHDIKLEEVATYNINKLSSRMQRGLIKGDGGDR